MRQRALRSVDKVQSKADDYPWHKLIKLMAIIHLQKQLHSPKKIKNEKPPQYTEEAAEETVTKYVVKDTIHTVRNANVRENKRGENTKTPAI